VSVLATDDFNRADGALGANWTALVDGGGGSAPSISSNQVVANGGTYGAGIYSAIPSPNANQYAQIVKTGTNYCGPAVRMSGSTWGTVNWVGYFDNGSIQMTVNGSLSTLGSGYTFVGGGNPVMRIEAVGSNYTIFLNGVQDTAPVTDATLSTGTFGLVTYLNVATLDDFEGGDFSAVGGGAIVFNMQIG